MWRILILLRIDKVIDSIRKFLESLEKRRNLREINKYKSLANFSENVLEEDSWKRYFDREWEIIKKINLL